MMFDLPIRYLTGILALLVVWPLAILFDGSHEQPYEWWIAIAVSVTVLAVWSVWALVARVRDQQGAKGLEHTLRSLAKEDIDQARPDMAEEIESMRQGFLESVAKLKASKIGKQGYDALYALPWYMIIGPSGTGKTTALRESGLEFPLKAEHDGGIQGIGGTRNCEWWLANEAVILDTAGRYTSEDDDRPEWLAFLDLLRRSRRKKPLEGVFVAIGIDTLASQDEDEISDHAKQIRSRIDEIMQRLQVVVPVYLLITKCDLLPGFIDAFGSMSKNERKQIWGFTNPLSSKEPHKLFEERFDELCVAVQQRTLKKMAQERRVDRRERIFAFPEQLSSLRKNLNEFCSTLFGSNVYQETPLMRGVYFTSGTQEGRPIDRMLRSMSNAFGIDATLELNEPTAQPKSYFLNRVFTEVVFPDRHLAVPTASEKRRRVFARSLVAASFAIFSLAMFFSSHSAYSYNIQVLEHTHDALTGIERIQASRIDANEKVHCKTLSPALEGLHSLQQPHFGKHMGMFFGDILLNALLDPHPDCRRESQYNGNRLP